ncbi:MAG: EAL domain-containing protein [Cyanobacteria bacterium J06639_16]
MSLPIAALVTQLRSRLRQIQQLSVYKSPLPRIIWVAGRSVLVSSTLLTGLFLGLQRFSVLESLELQIFDRFVQLQPDADLDPRLLIVTINEDDLQRYGWPLSDQELAQGLSQLQMHQPRVIGLDLYRDMAVPPGQTAFATQLHADNLIAITNVAHDISPPSGVEADRVGFNNLTLDADGVLRRNLLFVAGAEQDYYSFALRVSLAYLAAEGITFDVTPDALFMGDRPVIPLKATDGGYQTADTRGYQVMLPYRTRRDVAHTVTFSQLLNGTVNPQWIRDKVVLVGTFAPSLKDMIYTPYSSAQSDIFQMPGVIIHAQMVSQLLDIPSDNPRLFRFWPRWGEWLWFWGWATVAGCLGWSLRHPLAFGVAGTVCLGLIGGIGWISFSQLIWIPMAEPALGFVAGLGFVMAHRLRYATTRDTLTGLLNRSAFVRSLTRSLAHRPHDKPSSALGVMFLGLNRFQLINQSLGRQMGDRLLLLIVDRLHTLLPGSVRLARVSGDEFALACKQRHNGTLTTLADQLQTVLADPFWLNQQPIVITTSIGIALTQHEYRHTPEDLLRDAHTAMYRAKSLGETHYQVFAAGMLEESVDRFTLEKDLRQGINNQEFVLHYQPIMSLNGGNVVGFEALVRWHHPKRGLLSPQQFIPLAEETGLIIPLGEWICQSACHQVRQWKTQFPSQLLMMGINISGRQFEQPELIGHLAQSIRDSGIEGAELKLEITESMVMGNVEVAIDLMLRLKSLGCTLGLDDFGTGYSSLNHLRRFPVDILKIDLSFVQRMDESREDHEIIRTIISLGHTLGMDLIAEGVETPAQAEALRSMDCEFGQGYYWAKPLPVEDATALLWRQESLADLVSRADRHPN